MASRAKAAPKVILVVGKSNSGKSTAARSILGDGRSSRVAVVNDRSDESPPAYERRGWEEVDGLEDTAVLIEDVTDCTEAQFKILQSLCNYGAHHSNLRPILILTHSIQKTGLRGVLAYATHVLLTLCKTNASALGQCLDFLKFPKGEKERLQREFVDAASGDRYGYCELDLGSGKLVVDASLPRREEAAPDGGDAAAATPPPPPRIEASRYLEHLKNPKKALLLHDVIYPRLTDKIKALGGNYELRLVSKSDGRSVSVSFLDYLDTLTDESKRPTREMRSVHTYVRKRVLVPDCLISNPAMKECNTPINNSRKRKKKKKR
jgi:hypothetical protein